MRGRGSWAFRSIPNRRDTLLRVYVYFEEVDGLFSVGFIG